jgi:hypothetical protein
MRTIDEIALSHNPRGEILVDDESAVMTPQQYSQLTVYNTSLPTGKTIGKRWRAGEWMGEYVKCEEPGYVGIRWRKILLVDA